MSVTFSRISSLSRMAVCPASAAESAGKPSINTEATQIGSAAHAWLERYAPAKPTSAIVDLAREFMVDPGELQARIDKCDFNPEGGEKEAKVYIYVPGTDDVPAGISVPGHVDWHKYSPESDYVEHWDYKFSAHPFWNIPLQRDFQWLGYSVALQQMYGATFISGGKYFATLGDEGFESTDLDYRELVSVTEAVFRVIRKAYDNTLLPVEKRDYRPNNIDWSVGCKGCAGLETCPAARSEFKKAVTLMGGDPLLGDIDGPETFVQLFDLRQLVSAATKASSEAGRMLRDYVDQHGPVSYDETHEVRVLESGNKRFVRMFRKESEPKGE